jgi:hypothetical protein
MSDLFHSSDFGATWETVDFRMLQGGSQPGRMEITSDPLVRYALNGDVPMRSTTVENLGQHPTGPLVAVGLLPLRRPNLHQPRAGQRLHNT